MPSNQHMSRLGFRLEQTGDPARVAPLLKASGVRLVATRAQGPWQASRYLVANTAAGGTAACAGWTRGQDCLVLHSVAVAAPSRGSGLGASLLATLLNDAMDQAPVNQVFLTTQHARRFFSEFGFDLLEPADIPYAVRAHPAFAHAADDSLPMVRRYQSNKRGLDRYAFRLVHNTTANATLPAGSVFFFRQSGSVLEASYRGTPVQRGHLIGSIGGSSVSFLWHHVLQDDRLQSGGGNILVDELADGRRELREKLGNDPGELLLREV